MPLFFTLYQIPSSIFDILRIVAKKNKGGGFFIQAGIRYALPEEVMEK